MVRPGECGLRPAGRPRVMGWRKLASQAGKGDRARFEALFDPDRYVELLEQALA